MGSVTGLIADSITQINGNIGLGNQCECAIVLWNKHDQLADLLFGKVHILAGDAILLHLADAVHGQHCPGLN